jgi:indolepyruvate ferredoxin oxidoreductase beta subunit
MKKDIILSGVGGQGILSIAAIIGYAAIETGLHLKQAEVHGMSQRGGDVQSHLRYSDNIIYSDLIPLKGADLILSVEPMEALRYKPYLSDEGWLTTNTKTYQNIPDYPDLEDLKKEIAKIKNHVMLDADQIAKDLKSPRSMNIVMLGAASPYLGLDYKMLEDGIRFIFGKKGEDVVNKNIKALAAGRKVSEEMNQ